MPRAIENIKQRFLEESTLLPNGYYEAENFSFEVDPLNAFDMFNGTVWFEPHIACAMYEWFFRGDRNDSSIGRYLPSYLTTKNKVKPFHNSNYGWYAFDKGYLYKCVKELEKDVLSRKACMMINNNTVAFSDDHTDKLCTNSISFRIRKGKLNMTVHMRSNDFLAMLPYDMFGFCMFYGVVFSRLRLTYPNLEIGKYFHFADSMHTNKINYVGLKTYYFHHVPRLRIPEYADPTFENKIYSYCKKYVFHYENNKNEGCKDS